MLRFLTLVACAGLLAAGVPARAGHNVQFNFPAGCSSRRAGTESRSASARTAAP